jgi:hypothetical protein
VTVAGCEVCGHTVESAGRGFFGESAGPCPRCGRLMLWITPEDGASLREANASDSLTRAVVRPETAPRTGETDLPFPLSRERSSGGTTRRSYQGLSHGSRNPIDRRGRSARRPVVAGH